jgi:thiol:disulfide interchange protein/DsbC/DsbD-like thiol-disulfide interchange protein
MAGYNGGMRFLTAFFALLPASLSLTAHAEPVRTKHVTAELVSETRALRAGSENRVAVRLEMIPEWHTYWRFPGDSGLPTEIVWHLPEGWSAGATEWPMPKRILVPPLVNYGYDGVALLAAPVKVPANAIGEFTLKASVSWLVCKEECVPEKAELALRITADNQAAPANAHAAEFKKLAKEQPEKIFTDFAAPVEHGKNLGLRFRERKAPAGESGERAYDFLPLLPQLVKGDKTPGVERKNGEVTLWMEKNDPFDSQAAALAGVLVEKWPSGRLRASEITVDLKSITATSAPAPEIPAAPPAGSGVWILVLSAFLGGLVLNLMPCVFPVLGIKVMSLVRQSGAERSHAREHGKAYFAGVVASFWILSAALIALRGAGQAVGWGFQLQQPMFVTTLILLLTFVAADLAGFIHWSGRWMGAGQGLAEREGLAGSFFTGVLAVVVATPCSAPFMGTAIGAAIAEPAWVVMLVFTALGMGLATPFLVLCYHPAYLKVLPKPGAWMERLKELFAFPIAGTVLWLLWVLNLQIGAEGSLTVEFGLLVMMLSVWARRRFEGGGSRAASHVLLFAAVFICARGASGKQVGQGIAAEGLWKPYSEAAVTEALGAGKPVFVDFTAAWCLTCQVNKKLVLDRAQMQDFFREKGVQLFLADWTNRDPAITKALEAHGRIGVPLYLGYPAGSHTGEVLPQLLTEDRLRTFFR